MKPLCSLVMCFLIFCVGCRTDRRPDSRDSGAILAIKALLLKYCTSYPTNYRSVKEGVSVRFKPTYTGDKTGDQVVGARIKPAIDGTFAWVSANDLRFSPAEAFDYDTDYEFIFELPELFAPIEVIDNILKVPFKTGPLGLKMTLEGIKIDNLSCEEQISYSGVINSSDYVSSEAIEDMVTARQEGKTKQINWSHEKFGKRHRFEVVDIGQYEEESNLLIRWNGAKIQPDFKGEEDIYIQPEGVFELLKVNLSDSDENIITASFSRPIDIDQDIDGLFTLDNRMKIRTAIEGNRVYIYPAQQIKDEFSLTISNHLKSIGGTNLVEAQEIAKLRFDLLEPAIRALSQGVILPQSANSSFPIESVNLKALDVEIFEVYDNNVLQFLQENKLNEDYNLARVGKIVHRETINIEDYAGSLETNTWSRISLNLSELIDADSRAIHQVRIGFQRAYAITDCDEATLAEPVVRSDDESMVDYSDDYYYNYEDRNVPCKGAYYSPDRFIVRNVIASDVGVIAKQGKENAYHFAISSLSTGASISGARVILYDYQQQLLSESSSSHDGFLVINSEQKAAFAIIEHASGYAHVVLDDNASNSLSSFDIGGTKLRGDIRAFIYADRGVHRPGDTIFLNAMVSLPSSEEPFHPVKLSLRDPKGNEKFADVQLDHVGGIYSWAIVTDANDITGRWNARLSIGPNNFSKGLRVESIKPNRLKIDLATAEEIKYYDKSNRSASITSTWLHGAPAKNLHAEIDAQLFNYNPKYAGYESYTFSDPAKKGVSTLLKLFDGTLNAEGKKEFDLKLNANAFPGKISADVKTRVFEQGGNFAENFSRMKISPFSHYSGVRSPAGKWGGKRVEIGENSTFKIVSISDDGKSTGGRKLSVGFYNVKWRWWYYEGERRNVYKFNSAEHKGSFYNKVITTDASGSYDLTYDFQDADYGRKMIRVCDLESGHCTGEFFYASRWGSSMQPEERKSLTKLNFKTDKKSYTAGEEVVVEIPSEQGSRILISVETGDDVMIQEWIDAKGDLTEYRFGVNQAMAPNVYLHATMVQSYDTKKNDLPIRMYGVIPIPVNDPETILTPEISMSDELEPEEEFEVRVSEENNRAMSYTVAIVDDGLLDLTNFSTPDPHKHFYAKQALGVKTWDLYDYVLTKYSGEIDKMISVGGGDGGDEKQGGKKANRFKPVVMTAGPFTLNPGEKAKHKFVMPNYIGSVRTMVIAKDDDAFGRADRTSFVKKPLMILPTLPRVTSPDEIVRIPVAVFAMEDYVKTAEIKIEASDNVEILGPTNKQVSFSEIGDKLVYFEARLRDELGVASFDFRASSGSLNVSQQVELEIRNPNPERTEVQYHTVAASDRWTGDLQPIGMKGTQSGLIEFSSLPNLNLGKRMDYLIRYPYGCLEQTTSAAFPQLTLGYFKDLSFSETQEIKKNVNGAIRRISRMQRSNGGFSYWPGSSYTNDWASSYAGFFLMQAQEQSYYIPNNLLSKWLSYQLGAAKRFRIKRDSKLYHQQYQMRNQAYRLLTMAIYGSPDLSSMNVLRQETNLPATAQYMLAAAYAYAGKKELAIEMTRSTSATVEPYQELSLSYGSDLRDMALIAMAMLQLDRKNEGFEIIKRITEKLNSKRWYGTQTVAQALVAVGAYVNDQGGAGLNFKFEADGIPEQTVVTDKPIFTVALAPEELDDIIAKVQNLSDGPLFVRTSMTGQDPPNTILETKDIDKHISLSVQYKDLNGGILNYKEIKRGQDFIAHVIIRNQKSRGATIENLALTQIFPSGWEIQSGGLSNVSDAIKEDSYDYRDVRDDRVYTFFKLGERKDFKILLTASYDGTYFLPPVKVEAMYDQEIQALTKAYKVNVVAP